MQLQHTRSGCDSSAGGTSRLHSLTHSQALPASPSMFKHASCTWCSRSCSHTAHADHDTARFDPQYPWHTSAGLHTLLLRRYDVTLINTYNATVALHLGHIFHPLGEVQDCLHYCSPGIPEVSRHSSSR